MGDPLEYLSWFENLLKTDDFITSDKFLSCAHEFDIPYFKRDFLFRPGFWRGHLQTPIWCRIKALSKDGIFVGHADQPVSLKDIQTLKKMRVKMVYGTNIYKNRISRSVPLGLTNDTNESALHKLFGNTKHFRFAHETYVPPSSKTFSIYVNFTSKNNVQVRDNLLKTIENLPNIIYSKTEFTDQARIAYLKDLRANSVVLCPEGNGIDTHRLWETLYMGGVPIIVKNDFLPAEISQLPVIQLDSWRQILDINWLESEYNYIRSLNFDYNLLSMSWWKEQVFRQ